MSWRDRPYASHDYDAPGAGYRSGGLMGGMPRPGRVVGWLLIVNVAMFFLQVIPPIGKFFHVWLTVIPSQWWQVWRYLTFQFLHAGLFHILFNMIGLYFLGMLLEAGWGSRRFLVFYLVCGAAAGAAHVVMAFAFGLGGVGTPLLGASGGVYAVVLACAVFYPQVRVIVFLFPMPIRFAAALFLGIAVFSTLGEIAGGGSSGGVSNAAHLGGAAAAAVWIWVVPRIRMYLRPGQGATLGRSSSQASGSGNWRRKIQGQQVQQEQIDRILDKIRREGIGSLNRMEKRALRQATEQQKNNNK